MTRAEFDVAIVGAGIIGVACAEACAAAGLRVVVLERDRLGSGTTGAGTGHLVVLPGSEPELSLTRYSLDMWHQRQREFSAEARFNACGTLWLARDEQGLSALDRMGEKLSRGKVETVRVEPGELRAMEPNLGETVAGALLVPRDAVVDPLAATRHLWDCARRQGAQLREGCEVTGFHDGRLRFRDGSGLAATTTVAASGVDAPSLVAGLPVRPRKGNLVLVDVPPGFIRHQLVEADYLASVGRDDQVSVAFTAHPRSAGELVLGSSRQYVDSNPRVDPAIAERICFRAGEFIPAIRSFPVRRAWAGFRPATPDHLPLIGRVPEEPDLIVATGHEGLGITASLATGRLVSDIATGRPSEIPRESYSLAGRKLPIPASDL